MLAVFITFIWKLKHAMSYTICQVGKGRLTIANLGCQLNCICNLLKPKVLGTCMGVFKSGFEAGSPT